MLRLPKNNNSNINIEIGDHGSEKDKKVIKEIDKNK